MTSVPFACPRPVDLLALGDRGREFEGWCLEAADEDALATRALRCRVSLERRIGERRAWSSGHLGELAARRGLRYDTREPGPVGRAAARARLEDKISARRSLEAIGVPVPRWLEACLVDAVHETLAEALGVPYVIQLRQGSGGTSTWCCHEEADLQAVQSGAGRRHRVLVSSFVAGPVLNTHCLVERDRLVISAPSLQVFGQPELSSHPTAYCGADFAAAARLEDAAAARELAVNASSMARGLGWRGLLGVDLILGKRGPVVLELNPRYQASTWLLSELERDAGFVPLGQLHIDASRSAAESPRCDPCEIVLRGPVSAATLTVRARTDQIVQRRVPAGAYRWDGVSFTFLRACFGLRDLGHDEVFVDGAPASVGGLVRRGGVLARAAFRAPALDERGSLTEDALRLSRALSGLLGWPRPSRPDTAGPDACRNANQRDRRIRYR